MVGTKICPNCGGTHIWKLGSIPNFKKGRKKRFKCADCGKTFYWKGED